MTARRRAQAGDLPAWLNPPLYHPTPQPVREFTVFEVVACWACYGQPEGWQAEVAAARGAACGGGSGLDASGSASASCTDSPRSACAGACAASSNASSETALAGGGGAGDSSSGPLEPDAAPAERCAGGDRLQAGAAGASVARRPAEELALVVPLVRFMLMSGADLEAS